LCVQSGTTDPGRDGQHRGSPEQQMECRDGR
jgi:hypothetical protein